jgi:hypothetical protein
MNEATGPMRQLMILIPLGLLIGCGGQNPVRQYRLEQAHLLTLRTLVEDLSRAARRQSAFRETRDEDGVHPPEFAGMLKATMWNAERMLKQHPANEHSETIRAILAEAREIEVLNPTGPSEELTEKVRGMLDKAKSLEMRPMTLEEEAGIQYQLK